MPPKARQPSSSSEGTTDTDDEVQKVVELQQQQHSYGLRAPAPPPPALTMHAAPEPPQPPSAPAPPAKPAGKGGKAGKPSRRPAGAITIKTLVDAGLLIPGVRTLTVDYKSNCYYADLSSEGQIHCNGLVFDSPSAFSIYIKRLVNPTRKADDGWKSVKHAGRLLETYKDDYLRMQQPQQSGQATSADGAGSDKQTGSTSRGGRGSSGGGARQAASNGNGVAGSNLPAAKRHRASEPQPLVGTTAPQQLALAQHTTSGPTRHLQHLHHHVLQQQQQQLLLQQQQQQLQASASGSQQMLHDPSTGPPQPPPPAIPSLPGSVPAPPPPPFPPSAAGLPVQPELPAAGLPAGLPAAGMVPVQPASSEAAPAAPSGPQLMGAAVAAQAFG